MVSAVATVRTLRWSLLNANVTTLHDHILAIVQTAIALRCNIFLCTSNNIIC